LKLKSEISSQRDGVKQDAYRDIRDRFPGGLPGAVASTLTRDGEVPALNEPTEETETK